MVVNMVTVTEKLKRNGGRFKETSFYNTLNNVQGIFFAVSKASMYINIEI